MRQVKENVKATLTVHSRGTPGRGTANTYSGHACSLDPRGGRSADVGSTVLANSLMGSALSLLHAHQLRARAAAYAIPDEANPSGSMCFAWGGDVLIVGLIANYAAVAADTFSSELGILSRSEPRLITSPTLRKVPRGTNGGVTLVGLAAGLFGSMVIVTTAVLFLPVCSPATASMPGGGPAWTTQQHRVFMSFMVVWGALGSVLDSFLGATLQRTVRDARSGKIVEGEGGNRVLVSSGSRKRADAKVGRGSGVTPGASAGDDEGSRPDDQASRVVESGWDLLDNNDVNFLMASTMSVGAMAAASWYWEVPLDKVLRP